jgi:hypothetical protein
MSLWGSTRAKVRSGASRLATSPWRAARGCRYVGEEVKRADFVAHVAEPADTAALRGNKRRAKTDRADARHLRELLMSNRLPESWIPPHHVIEARSLVRLYKNWPTNASPGPSACTPRSTTTACHGSPAPWGASRPELSSRKQSSRPSCDRPSPSASHRSTSSTQCWPRPRPTSPVSPGASQAAGH